MDVAERTRAWLILLNTPGVGSRRLRAFLDEGVDPAGLPGRSSSELRQLGFTEAQARALRAPDQARLDASLAWLDHPDHHLVAFDDALFPPLLKTTSDAPAALFVHGDPESLVAPQVAIVGSRRATRGGLDTASEFAAALAATGLIVTSGMAAGIDGAAHRAALEAGGYYFGASWE